jgi:hypothetical protein
MSLGCRPAQGVRHVPARCQPCASTQITPGAPRVHACCSPYLKFGCLSPRLFHTKLQQARLAAPCSPAVCSAAGAHSIHPHSTARCQMAWLTLTTPCPALAPVPHLTLPLQIYSERKGKHTQPPVSLRCTTISLCFWHATAMPAVHAPGPPTAHPHCHCITAGASCCGASSSPSVALPSPTLTAWRATPSASRHA